MAGRSESCSSEPTSAFGAMLEHVNEIRRVSVRQDKRRRAADACRAMSTAPPRGAPGRAARSSRGRTA
jgi:hypothetical protein